MRQKDGFVSRRFEFRKWKTVILHEQLDSLPPVCYPGPVCPEELCQDGGHIDVSKFRLSITLGVHCWFTVPQTEGKKDKLTQMSTLACMLMEQRGIFPPFLLINCLLTNDWHSRSNPPLSLALSKSTTPTPFLIDLRPRFPQKNIIIDHVFFLSFFWGESVVRVVSLMTGVCSRRTKSVET